MSLPKLAVNRQVTVIMGVAMILLLGFVSLSRLPLDLLPDIEAPILAISTNYPNAGPHEVETLVSRPLEEALGSVNNVKSVRSVSSRGNSVVIAEFDWGIDMDFASLDVRERVDMVKDFLPDEADSPIIAKFDPSAEPIIQLVLRGDDSAYELRRRADELKGQFERLEGVASVSVSGGEEREIRVILHPGLLQSAGISVDTISQVLRASNLNLPAGSVVDNNLEYVLRTTGEFTTVTEIEQLRIPTNAGSRRLGDLAQVVDGFKETTQFSRYNGQPSIMLSIQKEASGNSVQVANLITASLERLNQQLRRDGLELVVAQDITEFIKVSVNSVTQNALIGGFLAVLMLLLFLRSLRATVVIGVAIPISIVATFVMMYFSGTTLNMVSLGGLALGVGMLVDNGIVVLENIYRHKEMGKTGREAAHIGAEQMGPAITASTITTISVFLPVVFVSGIAAEIFRDMALTVTFSLLASLAISMTLVPMLASRVLKQANSNAEENKLYRFMEQVLTYLQTQYASLIQQILRYRWITVGIALVSLLFSFFLVQLIGMEFMPEMDQGEITVRVSMPKGTRLADTNQLVLDIEEYARFIPEVASIYARAGQHQSGTGSGGGAETGRVGIQLVPMSSRDRSTDQIILQLRRYAQSLSGADVTVRMDGIFSGSFGAPIQVELRGDDLDLLHSVADDLVEIVAKIPGTHEVTNSMAQGQPEMQIQLDRDKVAAYGVTVGQVATMVRTAVSGSTVTRFRTGGQEIDITLRFAQDWRDDPRDVENIPIQTPRGVVPLKEFATLGSGEGPVSINRSERSRMITVTGQISDRDLGSVMDDVRREIGNYQLPPGVTVGLGGENQQMNEAFGQLVLAILLGIALVYMVLASQFESLLQPLVIMVTLPLAVVGVALGLLIGGVSFSVVAFVGAIMLAGIVVNNGIVFIDYVNQLRDQGYTIEDALVEAGKTRLRPILMTTLTTVLGMVPLAIGMGEGNELQRPIALVVIGGLTTSTLLTLFMIPIFYLLFEGLGDWITQLFAGERNEVNQNTREC